MKYIRIRRKKTKGMLTGSLLLLAVFAGCGPETGNEAGEEHTDRAARSYSRDRITQRGIYGSGFWRRLYRKRKKQMLEILVYRKGDDRI